MPSQARHGEVVPELAIEARLAGALQCPHAFVRRLGRQDLSGQGGDFLLFVAEGKVHDCSRYGRAQPRRARGIPRPNMAMRSRWISLVPPPKVRMIRLR